MTTAEWVRDSKKLGVAAKSLERRGILVNELESEDRDITRARKETFEDTKKKIKYFKASLQDIQDRLAELTKFRSHSGALQKSLETFESKLTSYKSIMRAEFDSLTSNEVTLEKDINFFLSRIDSWVKSEDSPNNLIGGTENEESPSGASKSRASDRYEKHVKLQSKIGSIDRQIANLGGRSGGWESQDHDSFIRCWVQTIPSNPDGVTALSDAQRSSLLRKLVKNVPIKTEEELADHVNWYLQYNELQFTKKGLLEEWKQSRNSQKKRDEASIVKETLDVVEESDIDTDTAFKFVDREAIKERVAKWRNEKEEEQRLKELRHKEEQKLEAERRKAGLRKRQEQLRSQIDTWKQSEEEYNQKIKDTETAISKPKKVTSSDLQARQDRDREITSMNLARKEAALDRKKSREVRIRELERDLPNDISATRDPARVLASTKAQSFRKMAGESIVEAESRRASASAHSATMAMSGRDLHTARRAVPSWSRGLS